MVFDEHGYLTPDEAHQVSNFQTLTALFGFNEHREEMLKSLLAFQDRLYALTGSSYVQWIDGSFISKKERPNDIDVVTFLPDDVYIREEKELRLLRKAFKQIDAYFVRDYSMGHPKQFITAFDRTEWLHLFTTDRNRRPKGFIEYTYLG